ncbi:acetoin utilization protein AcuC [Armatimonadetes bacterium GBS]|jgi:acetoin utilization protein AcuC|nr:Acetoin utilization protein AcuC [bacterium HR14]CUU03029.1 acetoin utilization protein AcuC [Armatimonadetes bacterium GBS]CUU37195.1 acetoin utilization protein AcuC [Armatimonadetes bacterium GXS]
MAPYFYDPAVEQYQFSESHPLKPKRLQLLNELLKAYGLDAHLDWQTPPPIPESEILRVHTPEYVAVVQAISRGEPVMDAHRWGFSPYGDNPPFLGMWEAALAYTSATVAAARAVRDGAPLAFNITGGLHHALPHRASGFCIFNDPAIAVSILRERFQRVAYLDIDLHHGDGVQWIFYHDPSVLTVSIHESGKWLFPGTGFVNELGEGEAYGTSINIPLAPFTEDDLWWEAFEAVVPRAFDRFQPEAIVLQMGADPHYLDPLGHLHLSAQGWVRAVAWVRSLGLPVVALGGGGYNLTTVPRMWTLAIATLLGMELPDETPSQFSWHDRIPRLTDASVPPVDPADRQHAESYMRAQVAFLGKILKGDS